MAKLIVQSGASKGTIYELSDQPMTIGRDLDCDIHLPDAKVSRAHARVAREGDRWALTDLESRNGTLVNGARVDHHLLTSLDEVALGDVHLLFVDDEEARHELPPEDTAWVRPTIAETVVSSRIELLSRGRLTRSREELEHANEGLITLFRYSHAAPEARSVAQLLDQLAAAVEEAIAPDRVVPLLVDPESGERRPWIRETSTFERHLAKVPVSRSIIDFAFDERLSVLSHAPAEDERFRDSPSIQLNRIATAMCVPLRSGERLLGAIYVDRLGEGQPFTRTDLELLTALAMPTVVALTNIRSNEELHRERQVLEREVRSQYHIIGQDPKVLALFDFIEKAAPIDSGVLLMGESGTGKELVARAIHYTGPRAKGPFEAVNCAAVAETLLDSELFGHVKGAFTGATEDRPGRFELAHHGTLFLDEIAEMPPASQSKLLRVLETGEFRRVGDTRDRTSRARVIAATNQDLPALVEAKRFREDLFYRLNVLTCHLPPLREHVGDLELLCEHFLDLFSKKCGKPRIRLSDDALDALRRHPWPGNVRELRNVLERLVVLSTKETLEAEDVVPELRAGPASGEPSPMASLQDIEKEHIQRVLQHTQGNKKEAAEILGIDRSTLYAKIKTYRLKA
ncbi:MAG: sigma 54-interacting transcriptional regulator [Candidatus Brocadiia bacterium]